MRSETQSIPAHASRRRASFTLFELVLVLALLGLLLGRSVPTLRGFLRGRATVEETRRLLAYSRYAAAEAISRGDCCELWFDLQANAYGLAYLSGFEPSGNPLPTRYLPESLSLTLMQGGQPVSEQHAFRWFADGTMDAAGVDALIVASRLDPDDALTLVPNDAGTRLVVEITEEEP